MKTLLDREDLVFNSSELGCVLSLSELPGGGSKIYDRSPYGNIGSITGAVWKRLPSGLWVLSFDGSDDYVTHPASSNWDFGTGDFTLKLWLYLATAVGANYDGLLNTFDGTTGWRLKFQASSQVLYFHASGGSDAEVLDAGSSLVGAWHHIVLTRNGSTMKGYVDAVEKGSNTRTDDITSGSHNLWLGCNAFTSGSPADVLDGRIALCKVCLHGVSTLEIQNHFNREKHLFGVW